MHFDHLMLSATLHCVNTETVNPCDDSVRHLGASCEWNSEARDAYQHQKARGGSRPSGLVHCDAEKKEEP